jgi:hypothetical protein
MDSAVPDLKSFQAKPVVVPTRQVLAGFPASVAQPGQYCWLEVSGYHTFDEGLHFYTMLEAFNEYVRHAGLIESCVDRMLVCISREETHIYANNNLPMIARMRAKRNLKAGEATFRDDIAGIDRVEFPGVCPPSGCGFMLLVSVGWRRGMCFDLEPLGSPVGKTTNEAFDRVKNFGGMVLAHLHFTERFLLSDEDWESVLQAGWFPFMFLPNYLWQELFVSIRNGWDLQPNEQKIHERWMGSCDDRLASWMANKHFKPHIDFLERAVEAYKKADWLTVVSVAAPRVEGLMRITVGAWGKQREVTDKLAGNVKQQEHAKSLLFPDRLRQYLDTVFFGFTKFSDQDLPSNRHTVTHGLVTADKLTRKEALTLLLLIDHVLYCMPLAEDAKPEPPC